MARGSFFLKARASFPRIETGKKTGKQYSPATRNDTVKENSTMQIELF